MMRDLYSRSTRCAALALSLTGLLLTGADWPRLFGPRGDNIAPEGPLPAAWSATENVAWKTALPGPGASSPIVLGNQIFLTAYSGYGVDADNPGKPEDLKLHLLCIDASKGQIVWDAARAAEQPEGAYTGFLALHGYASSTPTTDGKLVYAFFGRSGVDAYTLDGKQAWHRSVGQKTHEWGSAASPILAGDVLVVNSSVESESLVGLDKATGAELWRVKDIRESWSTPGLVQLADGTQELVVSANGKVLGVDPVTGKELWQCAAAADYVCTAVVVHGDVAYVSNGRKPQTLAVRGGGRGDISGSHKLWEVAKTPKVPSPVYFDGLLYWIGDTGVACCLKADTGKTVYEKRLSGVGKVYATLLAAGGKLYGVSREKGAVVLAAGPEFRELGRCELGDASVFNASAVPYGNRLLLRSDKSLYCLWDQ